MKVNKDFWNFVRSSWIKVIDEKLIKNIEEKTKAILDRQYISDNSVESALNILQVSIDEEDGDDEWDN